MTKYFGTNVKMHQTPLESAAYVDALATLRHERALQLFVILPFTSLGAVITAAHRAGIWVGAQNMHWAAAGEFTGEIAAPMLRDLDIDLVLIGHAERRHTFGETDALIRRKVEAALAHGLRVLLCVGETADERLHGASAESIVRQLKLDLGGLAYAGRVMVAYEPVWAIGANGSPADVETIASAVAAIRAFDADLPLLYGGSVSAESAAAFACVEGIDGLFVGRSARPASSFAAVAGAAYPRLISKQHDAAAVAPREEGWVSSNE